jgi:hypothetical protein
MTSEMQCIAYRVTSIHRQLMQTRFRSHGNEPPKHSNSKERGNSIVEGGDLHTVRPEPTSGRELTNRRQMHTDIHASNEIRTHDPSVRVGEYSSCLIL